MIIYDKHMSSFKKRKIDAVGKSSNGINLTWNDDDDIVGFDIVPKKKVKKENKTKKTTDKDKRPAQAKTNKGGKRKTRQNKRTRRIKSTR